MIWIYIALALGGAFAIGRIFWAVRRIHTQRNDSWDAKLIERLRKSGTDPFQPHDVDFFFGLPNAAVAERIAAQLRTEGYVVEVNERSDVPSHPFVVRATKQLKLSVPDMQAISRRFSDLAKEAGGSYDGWSAARIPLPH
jgi:hypothetical protein